MTIFKDILATNEFYHIYNKTVGDEQVFDNKYNLNRAIDLVDFYRFKVPYSFSKYKDFPIKLRQEALEKIRKLPSLVEIYSFSFMPNHFHFLLKQVQDNGINYFITNFQNAFARFYNLRSERKGAVFCHSFDRVRIEQEEQFIHVSRYIHLNPVTAYLIKMTDLPNYPYTSFMDYCENRKLFFLNKDIILNYFKNKEKYFAFVSNQEDYQKKLDKIKRLKIDEMRNI